MSSQKGNMARVRPQKHKNRTAFRNNLHDTSGRTKQINSIQVHAVCARCKEIIEWKIKYKKYKPLTAPRKCVKCGEKSVKKAYHVMCLECGKKLKQCTKCCESKEIIEAPPSEKEQMKLDNEMKILLQGLSERKRRTFLRYMDRKGKEESDVDTKDERGDLMQKLNELKVGEADEEDEDDFDSYEDDSD